MRWALVGVLLFAAASSRADITIGGGVYSPPQRDPIAVPDFSTRDASERQIGHELADIVAQDLNRSMRFNALGSDRFKPADLTVPPWTNDPPSFDQWKLMNMQALLQADVELLGDKIRVRFHLWDVYAIPDDDAGVKRSDRGQATRGASNRRCGLSPAYRF